MEEKVLMLVNLNYDEGEQGNIIYEVPAKREGDADLAIRAGHESWDANWHAPESDLPDSASTIEPFIEKEFQKRNIPFKCMNYAVVNLDI